MTDRIPSSKETTDRSAGERPSVAAGSNKPFYDELTQTVDTPTQPSEQVPGSGNAAEEEDLDELLEGCLEKYLECSPLESSARLRDFLPDASPATQRFLLVELIKLDMAAAAELASEQASKPSSQHDPLVESPRRIETYLSHFGDLMSVGDVPLDLLMEEIQLRKEAGDPVSAEEYAARFPQHATMASELLGGQLSKKPEATASVQSRGRPPDFRVGQKVDDFVVIQTLGKGAFANVYLARQVSMSRLVALKVSKGTGDEPQALAQFDHPNIVRVFDQRAIESPDVHLLYMQFHPGGTLAEVVNRVRVGRVQDRSGDLILQAVDRSLLKTAQAVPERSDLREKLGQMSWPMAVAWIGIQLSRALESAHRRGVMHRDVKPANVLLSAEGVPKLADFNVSFSGSAGRAGAASSFGGSIGYMAPEHLRAISATALCEPEEVGSHADLYSLAILLWELWQGQRPFTVSKNPSSWTEAVTQQLDARASIDSPVSECGNALERLLENILRDALSYHPDDRIGSGTEFEARLVLALHPDAAKLFDPEPSSWQGWLSRRSPWMVTSLIILVPNAIAGVFGYFYNFRDTLEDLFATVEGLESTFKLLATCVNSVAFPLAVVLIIFYTGQVVRGLRSTDAGNHATEKDLQSTFQLAQRAAVIGGFLWCLAAVLYPAVLWSLFPSFSQREVGHFFLSHVICGGVAAIYPFFGITVYAVTILYPRMVRSTLNDPHFDERVAMTVRRCERYLLLACLVPLMGATLLLVSEEAAKDVMMVAITATGLGLFAAFSAYRFILRQCTIMTPVLTNKKEFTMTV